MLSPELRSKLYVMFSDYFAFPDIETSPLLDQEVLTETAALLGVEGPPVLETGKILELQTAYTGLFINRPGGVRAHPYGAVYLETEPRLMGESTRAVLAAYQQAGVYPEHDSEPADSLYLELGFMAHLTEMEAEALNSGNQEAAKTLQRKQSTFCQHYLHSWLFDFCERVSDDETAHPLYRWGARVLACFSRTEELYFRSQQA